MTERFCVGVFSPDTTTIVNKYNRYMNYNNNNNNNNSKMLSFDVMWDGNGKIKSNFTDR